MQRHHLPDAVHDAALARHQVVWRRRGSCISVCGGDGVQPAQQACWLLLVLTLQEAVVAVAERMRPAQPNSDMCEMQGAATAMCVQAGLVTAQQSSSMQLRAALT